MFEPLFVTILPGLFLTVLFGGDSLMRRRNIDADGSPPIDKTLFYTSKYAIIVVWIAAIVHAWGVNFSPVEIPGLLQTISLCIWGLGFGLLLIGRFCMGGSFRIGSPKENTGLCVSGLFCISRNPMYLGVFSTLLGAVLYTLNLILLLIAIYIIAVHHKIVLAEEAFLRQAFGQEYADYCGRVRRYL